MVRRPRWVLAIPTAALSAAVDAREKSVAWRMRRNGRTRVSYNVAMPTVEALCALLGLVPHPVEGGFFRETYRGPRAAATAIYYLLTSDTVSAMHRLATDEVFHFYLGDPVEMLHLRPDGSHRVAILGP